VSIKVIAKVTPPAKHQAEVRTEAPSPKALPILKSRSLRINPRKNRRTEPARESPPNLPLDALKVNEEIRTPLHG
jgi:hypothetical protein